MAEKNVNWWKIALFAVIVIGLCLLSYYIGRKREPDVIVKTEVKYVELPPIHDTIDKPVPYKVVVPADTADIILDCVKSGKFADLFPKQPGDTVYITKEDTAAVIKDWATERLYAETLFDVDTLGRCDVNALVQYNRLASLNYTFTPIQKQTEITTRSVRKFLPYVGAGLGTNGSVVAQGGMFIKEDAGFALQYYYNWQLKQHAGAAMFLWMF